MLSYRHSFHAGGPADALKHAVLVRVLDYLLAKPKGLYLLDTHAGAGFYDLSSEETAKTGEASQGILRLLDGATQTPPALVAPYLDRVRASIETRGLYPGSPALLIEAMREQDRLDLAELHPADRPHLETVVAGVRGARIQVHAQDGLALLKARMPPQERRGLTIIDPSYEIKSDYKLVPESVAEALKRFSTGTILIWYPVIDRTVSEAFVKALSDGAAGAGPKGRGVPTLRLELAMAPDTQKRGMTASGVFVINPPYTLEAEARAGLEWLAGALEAKGGWRVEASPGESVGKTAT